MVTVVPSRKRGGSTSRTTSGAFPGSALHAATAVASVNKMAAAKRKCGDRRFVSASGPMSRLRVRTDPRVSAVIGAYPGEVRKRILALRRLIREAAREADDVEELEETLKWGEPSYVTKSGSTVRIDWKKKAPDQYAVYFKCTSRLVPTFRDVYPDTFTFEKDRAIVFGMDDPVPKEELKQCISAALRYHKVKRLPRLGITR
ncbi:MAG: DUF1801 domain-containing protein [Phycisphaerales bacterium]|nr:DUF1801 domain-containing protein [Phycisphaerales bacterium]